LHLIRILSANNSSPFKSSVSIISVKRLLTSGLGFDELFKLNDLGEAIVFTTDIRVFLLEVIEIIFSLIILF